MGAPPVEVVRWSAWADAWEVAPVLAKRAVDALERPACSGCEELELCAGREVLLLRDWPRGRERLDTGRVPTPVALERYAAGVAEMWER